MRRISKIDSIKQLTKAISGKDPSLNFKTNPTTTVFSVTTKPDAFHTTKRLLFSPKKDKLLMTTHKNSSITITE